MASVIKNFLGYLNLNAEDDYEDDYMDDYEEKEEDKGRGDDFSSYDRYKRASKSEPERTTKKAGGSAWIEEGAAPSKRDRVEKSNSKVVPIRKNNFGLEVCILKPKSFDNSQDICDELLNGRAAVVNLEGFEAIEAQRIMDFVSGCIYAINGKIHQVSKYIFIYSPENVEITGDYLDLVSETSFGVPTINREF